MILPVEIISQMKKKINRFVGVVVGSIVVFLLLITVIASVVLLPVALVHDFFVALGPHYSVDAKVIAGIQNYLDSETGQKEVYTIYQPIINQANKDYELSIPLHYVIIPNLLAGITSVDEKGNTINIEPIIKKEIDLLVEKQVEQIVNDQKEIEEVVSYDLRTLYQYSGDLKMEEEWETSFSQIDQSLLADYIQQGSTLSFVRNTNIVPTATSGWNTVDSVVFGGKFPPYKSGYTTLPGNVFGPELLAQCTWYVANRYLEFGINIGGWGNGGDWYWQAQEKGYPVGKIPKPGMAVSYPPMSPGTDTGLYWYAGHIAFVEDVLPNGDIITSNMSGGQLGSYELLQIPKEIYQTWYYFIDFGLSQ